MGVSGVPIDAMKLEEALRTTHGNFQLSAKMLGCSREAIYQRVKKSERLKKLVTEEREVAVDYAESALQRAVLNGEPWAIQFTLKTLGKSRGYIELKQIEHTAGDGKREVTIGDLLGTDFYKGLEKKAKEELTKFC